MDFLFVSLFKRSNGVWYILYTQDGRQRWKSTKTKLKANALKQLRRFQESREPAETKPQSHRLSEFADEFLAYARVNYARRSVEIFTRSLKDLSTITGDCQLTAIDTRHVDLYRTAQLQRKSPVSVNIELRSLRTMFNFALRWKLLQNNPFARVQLIRVPEMPPVHFTREEFRAVMKVIDQEWLREIVMFTLLTGMRRGEVANLYWSDLDLERRLVHVHSTPTFRSKWGKQRLIPLNDWIVQEFSSKQRPEGDDYLFTSEGNKVDESYLTHKFTDYVRATGLKRKLHFHSLRHTFATWLVQDGVSIYEIQKLLGHSSIEMTQIYSHLAPGELHSTVNKITLPLN